MTLRTRAILMNAAIVTGLIIQCFRGARPIVVAASGVFILVIANSIMIFAAKRKASKG